ncbi:MAG TPA: hypothetical protein VM238_15380 [Phycisphaerae bacterium]|nr:hypothetical protein [Phycisphaerae bacterium]
MSARRVEEDPVDALIVFADIVGSSNYSAVLGYDDYARRLLEFQDTFRALGRRYFPEVTDKATQFSHVEARGDEGVVFVTPLPRSRPANQPALVFRAIEFLFHLKGRLELRGRDAPRGFEIGAGIHWGPVIHIISSEGNRSFISEIEGFAINYAKRVESCSREGRYSRIFLSPEAVKSLEFEPVVLSPMRTAMRGIEDRVDLFEVRSGLFEKMDLRDDDEELLQEAGHLAENPTEIDAPWVKAFVVSALEAAIKTTAVKAEQELLRKRQAGLAWHSPKEDDPILLYLRSLECRESGQHTRELRYLRSILQEHPDFLHARLRLIKTCWVLAKSKAEPEDKLFARDMAREFLDHYGDFLKPQEKKDFRRLLRDLGPRKRPRR